MKIEVVQLPKDLREEHLRNRTVVVFDVLRATTSMTAALAAGVKEVRIFANLDDAKSLAAAFDEPKLLCGESNCLPPTGFDLGNSPGVFERSKHAGRTMFMSTTNGTRALVAAAGAESVLVGAIVNASAVARYAKSLGRDVTLLCAGTDGEIASEDLIGAGAVLRAIGEADVLSEATEMAARLFDSAKGNLREVLAASKGGQNVIRAGLPQDIDFAAAIDRFDVVGRLESSPLRIVSIG